MSFEPRVFIIRQGEREDHVDPETNNWVATAKRPQDPDVSSHGKDMGVAFGQYLVRDILKDLVKPAAVTICSSPLTRCVSTSLGIAEGMVAATVGEDKNPPAIHIEDSLVQEMNWMARTIVRNYHAGMLPLGNNPPQAFEPLWLSAQDHHNNNEMVYHRNVSLRHVKPVVTGGGRLQESQTLAERCQALVTGIRREWQSKDQIMKQCIVLVTHAVPGRTLLDAFVGRAVQQGATTHPASVTELRLNDDGQYIVEGKPWSRPHFKYLQSQSAGTHYADYDFEEGPQTQRERIRVKPRWGGKRDEDEDE